MTDKYAVDIGERALANIHAIRRYIAKQSTQNARMVTAALFDMCDSLETMPHRFAVQPNVKGPKRPVRRVEVHHYVVYFHVDEGLKAVEVLAVRRGRRPRLRRF